MIDGSRTPQSHTLKPIVRKATKMDMLKCCTKCGETKTLDEFYSQKTGKDGRRSQCRVCVKAYRKDNAEKRAVYDKQYRKDNTEKTAAYNKQYRQTTKGKAARKNAHHKRRTKKREGDVTTAQLLELQQTAKSCYWCGKKLTAKTQVHIDHYIPLSKGGGHTLSNLVVACKKCNITKNSKDPQDFAISLGRLL
jgi:5-methylcytosine-specific restriction endonuclease McrA